MSSSTKSNPASDASPATGSAVDSDDAKDVDAKDDELAAKSDDKAQADDEAKADDEANEVEATADAETGDEPDAKVDAKAVTPSRKKDKRVVVTFEVSRHRDAWWTAFGVLFGALLIAKLGTVGVWAGVVLVVYGLFRGYELLQSFRHAPGLIEVTETQVTLPRGVWMSSPIQVPPSAITSVYFLRRSVPWNNSAPVLVVELGSRALAYPRDWFASEADQRHVVHALLRNSSTKATVPPETAPKHDEGNVIMWAQLLGGVALLAGGVIAWMLAPTPISNGKYVLFIAPIFTGWIFAWRGLMRW